MTTAQATSPQERQIAFCSALLAALAAFTPARAFPHLAQTNDENKHMALALCEYLSEAADAQGGGESKSSPDDFVSALPMPFPAPSTAPAVRMRFLTSAVSVLDRTQELQAWIDLPAAPGEDIDERMPESIMPGRRLSSARAAFLRAMALAAFALGVALTADGNKRDGLHKMLCAATILDTVARGGQRSHAEKLADTRANAVLYCEVATVASALSENEHAIDYATKLVALHEIAAAESVDKSNADPASGSSLSPVDASSHMSAQVLLGDVAFKGSIYGTAVHAYTRALELFDQQDPSAAKSANKTSESEKSTSDSSEQANKPLTEADRQRLKTVRELCIKIVDANENVGGDALISLTYARRACEIGTTEVSSDSGVSTNEDDVRLVFRTGVLTYKYALQLAGGIDHASSPPVAAIVNSDPGQKPPQIRGLLDEAIQLLEDASAAATSDTNDPFSKRSVSLQLALVYMDIREEDRACDLLKTHGMTSASLIELDQHRRHAKAQHSSDGYSPSLLALYAEVVYSPEVFRRLISVAPAPEPSGDAAPLSRLTLSRGRRNVARGKGSVPVATKASCAYCCMTFSSDDPIYCEHCAAHRTYVYYCTDECAAAHHPQHEAECAKDRSPHSGAVDFALTSTISSFLST